MKRMLLLCAACCMITAHTLAQQDFSRLEIVVEGSALTQSFSGLPDDVMTYGEWGANAALSLRIGGPIYVEPGISFAGSIYEVETTLVNDGFEEDVEDVLGHLGVRTPVFVGYRFLPESNFNLRIFAGVAPLFITRVEEESDFEIEKDDYKSPVWNAGFGAGIDILFLTFNAYYEAGLTNLFDDVTGVESSDIKLNGLGGGVGLRFRL